MDPQNAEYWIAIASQWIQSKSQTPMMSFPNYPFSQMPQPQVPQPPRISVNDATANDNLVEADMDIEDAKEEEEEPTQIWADWQLNHQTDKQTHQNSHQNTQQLPPVNKTPIQHYKHHSNEPQSNRTTRFVQIPSAPIIGQIEQSGDHSQSVDMMLDSDDQDEDNSSAIMEAQKRKKLPVWIREGLERIEREKKQEEMRIQREQELLKGEESRKKLMEEALKELESEKMSKSKYESESEDDDEDGDQRNDTSETETNHPVNQQEDEEAFEKMMLLVRKTLTEILLEVTDEKILEISNETLAKYTRRKASSVTSNRTVTNSLGLGAYGNSSDEDSDGEECERADDHSDWEPENVLKERIRVKSIAFEQKAREIKEKLAELAEAEHERFSRKEHESHEHSKLKTKHDLDSEKSSKIRKNVGEEKYEQIYSISQSFASSGRQRDKKKTRFNDPKERTSSILMTHVGMLDTPKVTHAGENGSPVIPAASSFMSIDSVSSKKRDSSTSTSSSSSGRHKKHKKHKKSSKRSKKSSKKRDRSRSRDYDKDRRKSYKSDRRSIDSKSSIRSSDSKRHRSRSRSRSRDRHRHDDRHRSRRY